jgi:hypothetical protein
MEEVGVDGATEADDYERGQQQRHAEIEITAQEFLEGVCSDDVVL